MADKNVKASGITKARRERMAEALRLREGGATYNEIAAKLGVSRTMAFEDVQTALKEITREPAETVLTMELQRIDHLWMRAYTMAMKGDMGAMDRAIKLIDRRITLHGLDVNRSQVDVTVMEAIREGFQLLEETPLEELDPEQEF